MRVATNLVDMHRSEYRHCARTTTAVVPSEFIAIALGDRNAALVPVPSVRLDDRVPANVDTSLDEITIIRTRKFALSA